MVSKNSLDDRVENFQFCPSDSALCLDTLETDFYKFFSKRTGTCFNDHDEEYIISLLREDLKKVYVLSLSDLCKKKDLCDDFSLDFFEERFDFYFNQPTKTFFECKKYPDRPIVPVEEGGSPFFNQGIMYALNYDLSYFQQLAKFDFNSFYGLKHSKDINVSDESFFARFSWLRDVLVSAFVSAALVVSGFVFYVDQFVKPEVDKKIVETKKEFRKEVDFLKMELKGGIDSYMDGILTDVVDKYRFDFAYRKKVNNALELFKQEVLEDYSDELLKKFFDDYSYDPSYRKKVDDSFNSLFRNFSKDYFDDLGNLTDEGKKYVRSFTDEFKKQLFSND